MAAAPHPTGRIRRRLLGYDRRAVDAALATAAERLHRAETRRDELIETTANVERIGAQVADMLRSLADRAVELEDDATAQAAEIVRAAEVEAQAIRTDAAEVLASAEATAQRIVETTRQQQAAVSEKRETAVVSLRIAMDQMGRLATLIDEIDLTAPEPSPAEAAVLAAAEAPTVVHLPSGAPAAPAADAEPSLPIVPESDALAAVRARIDGWARSS